MRANAARAVARYIARLMRVTVFALVRAEDLDAVASAVGGRVARRSGGSGRARARPGWLVVKAFAVGTVGSDLACRCVLAFEHPLDRVEGLTCLVHRRARCRT